MQDEKRYQLRYAAGTYWVLDMEQSGKEYKKPVMLNECGAEIWNRHLGGEAEEQIVQSLQEKYEIDSEEAVSDIRQFLQQLKDQGIL